MNSSLESVMRPGERREKLLEIVARISGMRLGPGMGGMGPARQLQMVRISTVGKGYKYHLTLIAHSR